MHVHTRTYTGLLRAVVSMDAPVLLHVWLPLSGNGDPPPDLRRGRKRTFPQKQNIDILFLSLYLLLTCAEANNSKMYTNVCVRIYIYISVYIYTDI